MNSKIRVVSLFAGCGGLDVGFLATKKYEVVWANDFDKNAALSYAKNIGPIDTRDITKVPTSDIKGRVDVLLAGFPCQPFSNAGNRKGVVDTRGTLFHDALRFINDKKPKVVVFENVRGLLSISDGVGGKLIDRLEELLGKAGKTGYEVNYKLVKASDYGVPQNRYRVVIVGIRKDLKKKFIFPDAIVGKGLTVGEALKNLPSDDPNDEHWELSPQSKKLITHIPEGGSWKNVPTRYLPERLLRIKRQMKKYHSPNFYRRFSRQEIAGTITAAGTPENSGILHPTENRRYTVREIARIQSFPDKFIFVGGSVSSKYHQIGNAVPPKMAQHMATAIYKQVFEKR